VTLVPIPLTAAALKVTTDFLERFGGISGFVESILGVPKGYAEHWHQQNLIRWYDEWQAENAKRKLEGRRSIPPSLLMPALHKIAIEDDDDMLTKWARLFANFQDPDRRVEPKKIYVSLLSEMQALDVRLLEHVVTVLPGRQRIVVGDNDTPVGVLFITPNQLASDMDVSEANIMLSVHNLSRLGCLLAQPPDHKHYLLLESSPNSTPQVPTIITDDGTFFLSSLGIALVDACRSAKELAA